MWLSLLLAHYPNKCGGRQYDQGVEYAQAHGRTPAKPRAPGSPIHGLPVIFPVLFVQFAYGLLALLVHVALRFTVATQRYRPARQGSS